MKYKVLGCWPYVFQVRKAREMRRQLQPMLDLLPPVNTTGDGEIEIHMLCGREQVDMGIWASWSILRFMDNAVLYVHSDGTLTDEDICLWRKVIPSIVVVSKADADNRVRDRICATCPLLYTWRCNYWSGSQIVDTHLFGDTDRIIIMDSDVLCFKNPMELQATLAPDEPVYRWNRDIRNSYSADIKLLNQITGLSLPQAFNCGFCIIPRWSDKEFNHIEKMIELLKVDGRVDIEHFWSGQTYYAMCVAKSRRARALPDDYAVTLGRTSDEAVVRHYVGVPRVRPRYFTEGIPRLLKDLNAGKSAGQDTVAANKSQQQTIFCCD